MNDQLVRNRYSLGISYLMTLPFVGVIPIPCAIDHPFMIFDYFTICIYTTLVKLFIIVLIKNGLFKLFIKIKDYKFVFES